MSIRIIQLRFEKRVGFALKVFEDWRTAILHDFSKFNETKPIEKFLLNQNPDKIGWECAFMKTLSASKEEIMEAFANYSLDESDEENIELNLTINWSAEST